MRITYLIKNDEVKDRFLKEELPVKVTRSDVGTYDADDGKLYVLSFSVEGFTIAGARTLAGLRRKLHDDTNTRLLVDDASLKFAVTLYPHFAEYERELRRAITLATCAEQDNFDDGFVLSLERLTLRELGEQLFYDRSFQDKIKGVVKKPFTKDELNELIARADENTVWANLFTDGSLASVFENYWVLHDIRNRVMHQRLISAGQYDRARKALRESIDELNAYAERVLSDVSYPKRHAERAVNAAKLIRENYESMFQNLGGSLERFAAIANVTQGLSSKIDASGLASLATQMAGVQEAIGANQALMDSVRSISDTIGAVQTPGLTSALEAIGQQSQLQKLISEGSLAELARPAVSVDWPALQASVLSNVDTSAFSSLGGVGAFAIDKSDADDETSKEGPVEDDAKSEASS